MHRFLIAAAALGLTSAQADARARHAAAQPAPRAYEAEVSEMALMHGVPESLIHRVIVRESRYNPRLVSRRGHYGLMQISYPTARSMGYRGAPAGLLDAKTNLTYAVPYLANAYRAAGNSESGAVRLYSGGYYYVAKRRGLLSDLRSASSPSLHTPTVVEVVPVEEENPIARFFGSFQQPSAALSE